MKKTLYRDPVNAKLGGVCAGLAEYLNFEVWVVRIAVVSAFLLGFGFFATIGYIAAVLMLDKKPDHLVEASNEHHHVKQKPWQQGQSAENVLIDLEYEIKQSERKVSEMETYVTSREFQLNRQFKNL